MTLSRDPYLQFAEEPAYVPSTIIISPKLLEKYEAEWKNAMQEPDIEDDYFDDPKPIPRTGSLLRIPLILSKK